MHRTESGGNVNNLYSDVPPQTGIGASSLNAIQEELCNIVEECGTLNTAAQDDAGLRTQVYDALKSQQHLTNLGVTATWDEINTACDGITATATEINNVCDNLRIPQRAIFSFKDTNEIYIDPGCYPHFGTSNQICYWDSRITFQLGAGGSNADNSALGNDDWYYIYLDDSAIVTAGTNVIAAAQIVALTNEPAWSDSKRGWYSGNDKCIFAVRTNGSAQVEKFYHDGGDFIFYDGQDYSAVATTPSNTFTDATLIIPSFSRKAKVSFQATYVNADSILSWRTNGSAIVAGNTAGRVALGMNEVSQLVTTVYTDTSGIIEYAYDAVTTNTVHISTEGYFLPTGM